MFQMKLLTVTFIGRYINGKFSFVKNVKVGKFISCNISKDSKAPHSVQMVVGKRKTRSQNINDCLYFSRTLVKLVTCGFTKCDRNIGFYGLLNVFTYKTPTCIKNGNAKKLN